MDTAPRSNDTTAPIDANRLAALVRQAAAQHPSWASRLEKASTLVLYRRIHPSLTGYHWVESERTAGHYYRVGRFPDGGCDCQDYQRRQAAVGGHCAHQLAVGLLARLRKPERTPRPLVARLPSGERDGLCAMLAAPAVHWARYHAPILEALGATCPRLRLVRRVTEFEQRRAARQGVVA